MLHRRALLQSALTGILGAGCGYWPKTRTPTIAVEATAPAFRLSDHTGRLVSLADLTARGPALLVFYRGYW